jgi:hypothetical protein
MVFCGEKMDIVQHVLKNALSVLVALNIYKICFLGSSPTCVLYTGWPEQKG